MVSGIFSSVMVHINKYFMYFYCILPMDAESAFPVNLQKHKNVQILDRASLNGGSMEQ